LFINHYVSREEPSLETEWFIKKATMEKVQNLKNRNEHMFVMRRFQDRFRRNNVMLINMSRYNPIISRMFWVRDYMVTVVFRITTPTDVATPIYLHAKKSIRENKQERKIIVIDND
jgi:hypothetical protein